MIKSIKKKYKEISRIYGINRAPLYLGYYILHKWIEAVYIHLIKMCYPVDNTLIIFRSFPDYADNARALADYMHDNKYGQKYKIYFDVYDLQKVKRWNKKVSFISCESKIGIYHLNSLKKVYTAGFLMSTHRPILIRKRARKKQIIINLWHGCGYKDKSDSQGKGPANFDLALVPGKLFVTPKSHFWNICKENILPIGYPRYDWLKVKAPAAQQLLDSYKKNQRSKVVMWMPTYRADKNGVYTDTNTITQFPLIDNLEHWYELDGFCAEHNVVLIVKLHPFQKEYDIPFSKFGFIKEIDNSIFDNADVPMYKFIGLTDALISDYSSVAVDYLIVNRPMAFTLDDFEEYSQARGFVFDDPRAYMPGHHLYSFQDLIGFLSDISAGRDVFRSQRRKMYGEAICYSDNYCKSILDKLGIQLKRKI